MEYKIVLMHSALVTILRPDNEAKMVKVSLHEAPTDVFNEHVTI